MKLPHSELVKKVAQNARMSESDTDRFLKALQFSITDAIETEGDTVYIQNIGSFTLRRRVGKIDRLSGKPIKRDDKMFISFKPSKGLKIWKA